MDLEFGHDFIPRIGSQSYKAVDRCLGPDTLFDASVDLPWAIVDAPWAEKNPEFLGSLADHGTRVLLDDPGGVTGIPRRSRWRRWPRPVWAPPEPISVTDSDAMGRYVREALRCQAKLGWESVRRAGEVLGSCIDPSSAPTSTGGWAASH